MAHSLRQQLFNAIDSSFGRDRHGGVDKHEYRKQFGDHNKPMDKVFSSAERTNLKDFARNFAGFLKENYPSIKFVKEITSTISNKFLVNKALTCRKTTLDTYVSNIRKLDVLVQSRYTTENSFSKDLVKPISKIGDTKLRDVSMSKTHYERILQEAYKNPNTKSVIGLEMCGRFGLRVHEACNIKIQDIDFRNMKMKVVGKGGRIRYLDIRQGDKQFLQKAINKAIKDGSMKLCRGLRPNSLNRYIARLEERTGCRERYKIAKTSCHSIRKLVAQREWDRMRRLGYSKKQAAAHVNRYLGHSENRWELISVYVENPW